MQSWRFRRTVCRRQCYGTRLLRDQKGAKHLKKKNVKVLKSYKLRKSCSVDSPWHHPLTSERNPGLSERVEPFWWIWAINFRVIIMYETWHGYDDNLFATNNTNNMKIVSSRNLNKKNFFEHKLFLRLMFLFDFITPNSRYVRYSLCAVHV